MGRNKLDATTVFTVEGAGQFPFDMLRYDACWPYRGVDAAKLEHHQLDRRRVTVESRSRTTPTTARWQSFGWSVVGGSVWSWEERE